MCKRYIQKCRVVWFLYIFGPKLCLFQYGELQTLRPTDRFDFIAISECSSRLCFVGALQTVHPGLLWQRNLCPLHPGAEQPPVEGEGSQFHQKGKGSSFHNFILHFCQMYYEVSSYVDVIIQDSGINNMYSGQNKDWTHDQLSKYAVDIKLSLGVGNNPPSPHIKP